MDLIDLHQRMLRNVFLNVELLLNDGVHELSEYDVQSLMFFYFRRTLLNTTATAERERYGRVDCVVCESGAPVLLYEMKTYYKKREMPHKTHFDKDLRKLRRLLIKSPNARAYFLLAGKKAKFKVGDLTQFPWLAQRLHDRKLSWVDYILPDDSVIRLRPSQMQHYGQGVALSWEVKV